MKRFRWLMGNGLALAIVLAMAISAMAQEGGAGPGMPAAGMVPGEEMKAIALAELQLMGKNIVEMAKDMPTDKLGWNPGMDYKPRPDNYTSHDYGRTFANLCLHLSDLNFTRPVLMGAAPAPGFDPKEKGYEDSTTDRAKLVDQLTQAFTYAQNSVQKITAEDLAKRYKVGKQEMSGNAIVAEWMESINDYFGQAKAYVHMQMVVGTDPGGFHPYQPK